MGYYLLKVLVSATVLVAVAEIAKRNTVAAAVLASLPLTSLLAFVWLYLDKRDVDNVAALSQSIFWLVLPSLVLFWVLPVLLRSGWGFWAALGTGVLATVGAYALMLGALARFGIRL